MFTPSNPNVSDTAFSVLAAEASELQIKGAVVPTISENGEYVSSYFAVPKATPGKYRPILNLKKFNYSVKKYHFKMETFKIVRQWIKEGDYCISIDLKDAFPHIPINKQFWKYFKFQWLGQLLQWVVLPFGLRCSPRVLTKVLKPVMAFLRLTFCIFISCYMDDMLIQGNSPEQAYLHAQITALILMILGWSINWEKSFFIPSRTIKHLGFNLDTESMTISRPSDKINGIQSRCKKGT